MCGIVGYLGQGDMRGVLLEGLRKLEYRGYDSSGIAVIGGSPEAPAVLRHRAEGRISALEASLPERFFPPGRPGDGIKTGIAHTRWATHGRPSEDNAHPHADCRDTIVLIHNGIIENHAQLRAELHGHLFRSETDTEVVCHLLESVYRGDMKAALEIVLPRLEGSFAFVIMSAMEPGKLYFARRHSPLVIGLGEGETFIASDVTALLSRTRRFLFLENGDYGLATSERVSIFGIEDRKARNRTEAAITWDPATAEKSGFPHFMLKEIHEQPQVLRDNLQARVFGGRVDFGEETAPLQDVLRRLDKLIMIACGTSYHAALVGKYVFESLLRIPVEVDIASEFRYRDPVIVPGSLAVLISQSGETADTLACREVLKDRGVPVLGICNVPGSSLARDADATIFTRCGPEIGVASTKAFTGQLVCLYLLAVHMADLRGSARTADTEAMLDSLVRTPAHIERILSDTREIEALARLYRDKRDFLYLGRGVNYPIALEGALKLKEISYIHAEGYPAGEMKHGPIALIDGDMPVVVIATRGSLMQKILSNLEEAKSRDARVIALVNAAPSANGSIDHPLVVPEVHELVSPLINVVPLQVLAYRIADLLGRDVDMPRNLAKSVTVE